MIVTVMVFAPGLSVTSSVAGTGPTTENVFVAGSDDPTPMLSPHRAALPAFDLNQ
jgi:hypothetical protein